MSKRKGQAVSTQMMGFPAPAIDSVTKVGNKYPVITHVPLGERRPPTPTQTAGSETRPSRAGTTQFKFGKNST